MNPLILINTLALINHPHIIVDLRYTAANNFTGQQLYPSQAHAYVHKDVVPHLYAAADYLATQGVKLKIFDAYRPLTIQQKMWSMIPDQRYVSHPSDGGFHARGCAIDITLCNTHGNELPMPSDFDCFDDRAHSFSFSHLSKETQNNIMLLKKAFEDNNFIQYPYEWWHFTFATWQNYPLLDISFEELDSKR